MGEVGREGRTILFVSHNMQAVRQLCSRTILLEGGRMVKAGRSGEVIDHYLASVAASDGLAGVASSIAELPADPAFRLLEVSVLQDGKRLTEIVSGKPVVVEVTYEVLQATVGLHLTLSLHDAEGTLLFESIHNGDEPEIPLVLAGRYTARATLPADFLAPTHYDLLLFAGIHGVRSLLPKPIVMRLNVTGLGRVNRAYPGYRTPGRLAPLLACDRPRARAEVMVTTMPACLICEEPFELLRASRRMPIATGF
jgi:lipopolysaccharide transport system ATP-binding protein